MRTYTDHHILCSITNVLRGRLEDDRACGHATYVKVFKHCQKFMLDAVNDS